MEPDNNALATCQLNRQAMTSRSLFQNQKTAFPVILLFNGGMESETLLSANESTNYGAMLEQCVNMSGGYWHHRSTDSQKLLLRDILLKVYKLPHLLRHYIRHSESII